MIFRGAYKWDLLAIDFSELDHHVKQDAAVQILHKKGIFLHAFDYGERGNPNTVNVIMDAVGYALKNTWMFSYKRGAKMASAPDQVDCSSFAKYMYSLAGIWLPRRSVQQRASGARLEMEDLAAGDLVFKVGTGINHYDDDPSDGVGHVGIFTDRHTVIHAVSTTPTIVETRVGDFIGNGKTFRGVTRLVHNPLRTFTFHVPKHYEIETSDDIKWLLLRSM